MILLLALLVLEFGDVAACSTYVGSTQSFPSPTIDFSIKTLLRRVDENAYRLRKEEEELVTQREYMNASFCCVKNWSQLRVAQGRLWMDGRRSELAGLFS